MSSKHVALSEEEFAGFEINPRLIEQIELHRAKKGLKRSEMRILDWGCGRGRAVLSLRRLGYSAFGVDIDPLPLSNASDLFCHEGLDPSDTLRLLTPENQTSFPDQFFDVIFSDQVIEHVARLESAAQEMKRLGKPGGLGVHRYPGNRQWKEPHIFIPFAHWLPSHPIRRLWISFFLFCGIDPQWNETKNLPLKEKAKLYDQYLTQKTCYRSPREIFKIFRKSGFSEVRFISDEFSKISRLPGVQFAFSLPFIKKGVNALLTRFQSAVLSVRVE